MNFDNLTVLSSPSKITTKLYRHERNFMEDMHSLLVNENFSDISLHCGSEVFRVHKNILSARSPVFAAMFQSPMKESQQDSVQITGMEPRVLRSMLSYMYCCRTHENMDAMLASELLSAANMYQVSDLKLVCVEYLKYIMNVENVLDILRIADLYDRELCKDAINFICSNYEAIEEKQDWLQLQKDLPRVVIEIMALKIESLRCVTKRKKVSGPKDEFLIFGSSGCKRKYEHCYDLN